MIEARYASGICYMNEFIYVTGGMGINNVILKSCERYNIIKDSWESFPSICQPRFSMTLVPMNRKYFYMFGGFEDLLTA